MIRTSCQRCGATLLRGVDGSIGIVLLDATPLSVTEEAAVLIETMRHDDPRRRRLSFDVMPTLEGLSPRLAAIVGRGVECSLRTPSSTPRDGAVMVEHVCGRWPARRLPAHVPVPKLEEEAAGDDGPPFIDRLEAEPDIGALSLLIVKPGTCPLCGKRKERKTERLCNHCRSFAHGRIYERGEPVVGWCEAGRHRWRTVARDTEGRWDCGGHKPKRQPQLAQRVEFGVATDPGDGAGA